MHACIICITFIHFSDVLVYDSEHESVVSVFESKMNQLHTTRSWHFLGLDSIYNGDYLPMDSTSHVIVGVIDSGNIIDFLNNVQICLTQDSRIIMHWKYFLVQNCLAFKNKAILVPSIKI